MKVLIVYDSVFGNTEQIAQAISDSLGSKENVETLRVNDVKIEKITGLDLLIVGSPTRGFRPTQAITNFLKRISTKGLNGVRVAAFDTRFLLSSIESSALRFMVKTGGYAARSIANRLKKKGAYLVMPPEGFLVTSEKGPLQEGELERAADWAKIAIKEQ
ncbi:flavodoxin family protein [bacterium]|nr:flavodoxin family protein [bacterium]